MSEQDLRAERLSLCIGTITGQLSHLLNELASTLMTQNQIYKELKDIHDAAGLQIHELYYKGN